LKIDHAQKLKIKKIETETETEILKIKRTNIYFFRGWENKKKKTTSKKPPVFTKNIRAPPMDMN